MKKLLTILLLIFVSANEYAGKEKQNPTYQVEVEVSYDDDFVKNQINSYIKRELRKLGDVEVLKPSNRYVIHLSVLKAKNMTGYVTGYSISFVFTEKVSHWEFILDAVEKTISKDAKSFVSRKQFYLTNSIILGSIQGLEEMCKNIVVAFDTTVVEPERVSTQKLKELKKRIKNKINKVEKSEE
ncbi:MAG: hypothetical protein FVQ85_16280 [Planctomycetes bacterium]|nr:hypothetical protein [Planctomycetota bacterium]